MGTSYSDIKDRFYKLLKGDKRYFNYVGLTNAEITQLTSDHFLDLLNQAIDEIYNFNILTPQIDFYDKDDVLECFNIELNNKEIGLLSRLCYYKFFCEDRNKLHEFMKVFKGQELTMLSPANERKSFLDMLKDMEDDIQTDIINYLSVDRLTGKIRTVQTQIELH